MENKQSVMCSTKWTRLFFLQLVLSAGFAQAQVCLSESVPASTPNSQLEDHGNGTITDTKTGLMWKQCEEGLSGSDCGSGSAELLTWPQALLWVKAINGDGGFAGFTDWRLPNIKELSSLVEYQCHWPSINLDRFPNASNGWIQSSSPIIRSNFIGRGGVEFSYGTTGPLQSAVALLRLVRSDSMLAGWTFNSETGHYYKRVSCGSWKQCESQAVAEGAHLVTINSAEENAWLIQTFGSDYLWIGFTDENSEGNWRWVSGEAVTYTNWADAEPNNLNIENHSHFTDGGKWNDLDGNRTDFTTDAIWEKN